MSTPHSPQHTSYIYTHLLHIHTPPTYTHTSYIYTHILYVHTLTLSFTHTQQKQQTALLEAELQKLKGEKENAETIYNDVYSKKYRPLKEQAGELQAELSKAKNDRIAFELQLRKARMEATTATTHAAELEVKLTQVQVGCVWGCGGGWMCGWMWVDGCVRVDVGICQGCYEWTTLHTHTLHPPPLYTPSPPHTVHPLFPSTHTIRTTPLTTPPPQAALDASNAQVADLTSQLEAATSAGVDAKEIRHKAQLLEEELADAHTKLEVQQKV